MRISDWSSDVCSSDLQVVKRHAIARSMDAGIDDIAADNADRARQTIKKAGMIGCVDRDQGCAAIGIDMGERKSVVSGKGVSVRVDLGGRRIITKTKTKR